MSYVQDVGYDIMSAHHSLLHLAAAR